MKTKTINIYSFDELSEEAKEKALQDYREKQTEIFWMNETIESLKGLFKNCDGIFLKDYSLGEYQSWIRVDFTNEEVENFTGKRAMAWLENNLLSNIRYKWGIDYIKKRVWTSECVKSLRKDGVFINLADKRKEGPFTGYCVDDDLLDDLIKEVKEGNTLKTAFENLAITIQRIIQNEVEYQNSKEYIAENFEANEYEFDEEGRLFN